MYYVDSHGKPLTDSVRLAGNVLLWQEGSITLRLEGEITESHALAIAASMPPIGRRPQGTT